MLDYTIWPYMRLPVKRVAGQTRAIVLVATLLFFGINAVKVTLFRRLLVEDPVRWLPFLHDFLVNLAILAIIAGMLFVLARKWLVWFLYTVQFLYLCVNLSYYQVFGFYAYLDHLSHLLPSLWSIAAADALAFRWWHVLLVVDIPVLALLLHGRPMPLPRVSVRDRRVVLAAAMALLGSMVGYWTIAVRDEAAATGTELQARDPNFIRQHGLLAFSIYDFFSANRARRANYLQTSRKQRSFPGAAKPRNIYLIQVEALDARVVGWQNNGRPVMPFLNRLRHEAVYYPFTLSIHTGGGSSDCDFSILNSIEPIKYTSVFFTDTYGYPNAVPRVLKHHNYACYAFHGNKISCWARDQAYPRMGYDDFFDVTRLQLPEHGWGAPDGQVFDKALNFIAKHAGPLFIHTITMSSHYPYNSVQRYYNNQELKVPEDALVQNYFNSVNYVDACLEKYVNVLRQRNDGAIVILGDHTPPRLDGRLEFNASKMALRGKTLEFVPLFIIAPELAPREESRYVASFLDVAPTLLSLSGVTCTYATAGTDLTVAPEDPPNITFDGEVYRREDLFRRCKYRLP